MTDIGSPAPMTSSQRTAPRSSGWTGWLFFAAAMMMLNGVVWVIEGLMALVNDDYFHVTASGVALSVNYTVWGFVHLLLGVAFFASGIGVRLMAWTLPRTTEAAGASHVCTECRVARFEGCHRPLFSAVRPRHASRRREQRGRRSPECPSR